MNVVAQKTVEQAPKAAPVYQRDRLPVTALFNRPPPNSPYHTQRAAEAREVAITYLPEGAYEAAAQTLAGAGLRRRHADIPDGADHNALTLAAALAYAAQGFHVIDAHALWDTGKPTNSGHAGIKVPRGAGWEKRASTDAAEIVKFWTGDGEYPENSIGEVRQYAPVRAARNVSIVFPQGCGLFVVDIDGTKGQEELAKLEVAHGSLPETVTSLSGSQTGFHMIFRTSETILNTASAIAPGIDIRGEGGQIIAPPSVHPSFGFYEWEDGHAPGEVEIADAPEWLVRAALESSKKSQAQTGGRRLRPEGVAPTKVYEPRDPTGDSTGFESILETIGDDAEGFDKPIYRAACSWFGAHGWDADASTLFDQLQEAILAAQCDNNRNKDRYSTPGYLKPRIEQARDYISREEAEEAAFCAAGVEDEEGEDVSQVAASAAQSEADRLLTLDITAPLGDSMAKAKAVLDYRFKAVNIGGDLVFVRVPDFSIENESRMEIWKEPALKRFHDDRKVQVKKAKTDKNGKEVEEWEWVNPVIEFVATAKRHARVEFAPPPARIPETTYNTFHGFQLAPVQGDCEGLKDFIRDVICAGDKEVFKWVWHWMAHMLQRPGEKPGTALVIHGGGRAGKGTFGDILRALVHPYAMLTNDPDQILGTHAGPMLANSILCVAEEAFFAADKKQSDKMKSKVTAPIENINPKHVQAFEMRSVIRFVYDGNGDQVVNIENNGSEERFCVMKVSTHKRGDLAYFKDLRRQINGPELAALAYELLQYDPASAGMEWGDVRRAPDTMARKRMGFQSRAPEEVAVLTAIEEGKFEVATKTGPVEYELNDTEVTRISTQHWRDYLKAHIRFKKPDSDNLVKIAERLFGKDHGFDKGKTVIEVAKNNLGVQDMEDRNVAYFEVPAAEVLRERMRELGYL